MEVISQGDDGCSTPFGGGAEQLLLQNNNNNNNNNNNCPTSPLRKVSVMNSTPAVHSYVNSNFKPIHEPMSAQFPPLTKPPSFSPRGTFSYPCVPFGSSSNSNNNNNNGGTNGASGNNYIMNNNPSSIVVVHPHSQPRRPQRLSSNIDVILTAAAVTAATKQPQGSNHLLATIFSNLKVFFFIASLVIVCDAAQFLNLRQSERFADGYDEVILGGSIIFQMSMLLMIGVYLHGVQQRNRLEEFFLANFSQNNTTSSSIYSLVIALYLTAEGLLRIETLLHCPQSRLNSAVLLLIEAGLMLKIVPTKLVKFLLPGITIYFELRYIQYEHNFLYQYIQTGIIIITVVVLCSFPISSFGDAIISSSSTRMPTVDWKTGSKHSPIISKKKGKSSQKQQQQQLLFESPSQIVQRRQQQQSQSQLQSLPAKTTTAAAAADTVAAKEMNNYLKEFYHTIVSMMPQGIVILDESQNLVYANKTTKKILSCGSKSEIIDALKRIIVKDLDAQNDILQEDNFFDNGTKSYRTVYTTNHKKRASNYNTTSNTGGGGGGNGQGGNGGGNCAASNVDMESQTSTHYFLSHIDPAGITTAQTQQIRQQIQSEELSFNNLQQQQQNPQQTTARTLKEKTITAVTGQRGSPKRGNQKNLKSPSLFFETGDNSLPMNFTLAHNNNDIIYRNSLQAHNLLSKSEGFDLLEKQYQVCSEQHLLSPGQKSQQQQQQACKIDSVKQLQLQSQEKLQVQTAFQSNVYAKEGIIPAGQNVQSITRKSIKQKTTKPSPFKYIHHSQKMTQKDFVDMSILEIVEFLLTECVRTRTITNIDPTLAKLTSNQSQQQQQQQQFTSNQSQQQQQQQQLASFSPLLREENKELVKQQSKQGEVEEIDEEQEKYAILSKAGLDNPNLQGFKYRVSYDFTGMGNNSGSGVGAGTAAAAAIIGNPTTANIEQGKSDEKQQQQQQVMLSQLLPQNQPLSHLNSMGTSQKSAAQRSPKRTNSVQGSSVKGLGKQQSSGNGSFRKRQSSSHVQHIRGGATTTTTAGAVGGGIGYTSVRNQNEITQNSLQVRIQLKGRLIEITFVQCDVSLFSSENPAEFAMAAAAEAAGKQPPTSGAAATAAGRTSIKNISQILLAKSTKLKESQKQQQSQTNSSSNNSTQSTAMVLVFLDDITKEVYAQRLEELNNYKMKMLSSVSHELKTPLNCSMGMLEQVNQYVESDEFKKGDANPSAKSKNIRDLIEPAQMSNQLLLSMIRDLLDLGTLEFGMLKYTFTKFNLKQMLEDRIKLMRTQGKLKKIDISLIIDTTIEDEIVVSDEVRLGQIIINFLSNSLKFTSKGGKILVKVESYYKHFKLSVEDNGIGIPQKKLNGLFKIFGSVNAGFQRRQATQGIGIGLQVSYRLAQGLTLEECKESPILVRSEEKKGTVFSFILKNQDPHLAVDTQREIDEFSEESEEDEDDDFDGDEEVEDEDDDDDDDDEDEVGEADEGNDAKDDIEETSGNNKFLNSQVNSQRNKNGRNKQSQAAESKENYQKNGGTKENFENQFEPDPESAAAAAAAIDGARRKCSETSSKATREVKISKEIVEGEENISNGDCGSSSNNQSNKQEGIPKKVRRQLLSNSENVKMNLFERQKFGDFIDFERQHAASRSQYFLANQNLLQHEQNLQQLNMISPVDFFPIKGGAITPTINTKRLDMSRLDDDSLLLKSFEEHDCRSPRISSSNRLTGIIQMPSSGAPNNITTTTTTGAAVMATAAAVLTQETQQTGRLITTTINQTNENRQVETTTMHHAENSNNNAEMDISEIDGEILLVDDVEFNLLTLQSLLKKYGFKINFAHDGEEAFQKVKQKYAYANEVATIGGTAKKPKAATYKIIFMDIQMPVKDGFEATKDIRKFLTANSLPVIPIIAASAFADASYKDHAKKVGMTDYLEKPLKVTQLDKIFAKYVYKPQHNN